MVIPEKQQHSAYKSVLFGLQGHDVREYVLYCVSRAQKRTSGQQIAMLPGRPRTSDPSDWDWPKEECCYRVKNIGNMGWYASTVLLF